MIILEVLALRKIWFYLQRTYSLYLKNNNKNEYDIERQQQTQCKICCT